MHRIAAFALLSALTVTACAAEPDAASGKPATAATATPATGADAAVRAALAKLAPGVAVGNVKPAPIAGYSEANLDGHVIYVSNDGRYLIQGALYDMQTRQDLTEASRAALRRELLAQVRPDQKIVFAPAKPTDTITVFTDIDCGYCRKLHSHIAEFNQQGIAVEYLFFPRTGLSGESFDKAVSVWCAADQRTALTESKAGKLLPKTICKNPVTIDYNLGRKIGIDGTPAIFTADGVQIGGYLAPAQMRAKLDALKADPAA